MLRHWLSLKIISSDFQRPSVIALVLANLFPIIGVLFFRWEVFYVLLLYWTENVIIGFLNAVKMLLAPAQPGQQIGKLFMIPFFCVHYGIFTLGHGAVIFGLFSEFTDFPDWQMLFTIIGDYRLIWGILAIFISHGVSFVLNYIVKKEYKTSDVRMLMLQPYGRVIILQVTIIIGGFLVAILGSPAPMLVVLVLLKIAIDLMSHIRQHRERTSTR